MSHFNVLVVLNQLYVEYSNILKTVSGTSGAIFKLNEPIEFIFLVCDKHVIKDAFQIFRKFYLSDCSERISENRYTGISVYLSANIVANHVVNPSQNLIWVADTFLYFSQKSDHRSTSKS